MARRWSIPRTKGTLIQGVERLHAQDPHRWRCHIHIESPRVVTVFDAALKESLMFWVFRAGESLTGQEVQQEIAAESARRAARWVGATNGISLYVLEVEPAAGAVPRSWMKFDGALPTVEDAISRLSGRINQEGSHGEYSVGDAVFAQAHALFECAIARMDHDTSSHAWAQVFFETFHHRLFGIPYSADGIEACHIEQLKEVGLNEEFDRMIRSLDRHLGQDRRALAHDYVKCLDVPFADPLDVDESTLDWMVRFCHRQPKEIVWQVRPESSGIMETAYRHIEAHDPTLKPQEILDRIKPPEEPSLAPTRDLLALWAQGKPITALKRPFDRAHAAARPEIILNSSVQWRPRKWLIALRKFSDAHSRWAMRVNAASLRDPAFQSYLLDHFHVRGVILPPAADGRRSEVLMLFLERADGEFLAAERDANYVPFVRFKKPPAHLIPPRSDQWQEEALRLKELDYWKKKIQMKREVYEDEWIRIEPVTQKSLFNEGYDRARRKYMGHDWMRHFARDPMEVPSTAPRKRRSPTPPPVIRVSRQLNPDVPKVLCLGPSSKPRIYQSFDSFIVRVAGRSLPMGRWKDVQDFLSHYDSGARRFRIRRVGVGG